MRLAAQPAARARAQLLALFGVGEETADAILVYALGHPAIVVDEYFRRIAVRHGLAAQGEKYSALQKLASEHSPMIRPRMRLPCPMNSMPWWLLSASSIAAAAHDAKAVRSAEFAVLSC